MPILDLSIDALLTTTRTVRKRLDLARPVEPEVMRPRQSLTEEGMNHAVVYSQERDET